MKIADARYLADTLIDTVFTVNGKEVCARKLGYDFEWMSRKKTLGLCDYNRKKILLSEDYVYNNQVELVEDTIRHELAHAFSHHIYGVAGCGHNHYWRGVCVQVGAKPKRSWKSEKVGLVTSGHKYVLRHKETKEVFGKYFKFPHAVHERVSQMYIKNRRWETLGKLELVGASEIPMF